MADVVITTDPGTNISTGLNYIYTCCISPKFNNTSNPRIFVASSPPNPNNGVGFTVRYADYNGTSWGAFNSISDSRLDTVNQGWTAITSTADGTRVIVAGLKGYIYMTTWNTSTLSYSVFIQVTSTSSDSTFTAFQYSGIKTTSTGSRLVMAATGGNMWFAAWNGTSNYATPTSITVTNNSNTNFAMSTDGSKIVYAGTDNKLYMLTWNGNTYTNPVQISTYTPTSPLSATYRALEFSGDMQVLYATSNNSNIISYFVWDKTAQNYNERKIYDASNMTAGVFNKTAIGIINTSRTKSKLYIIDTYKNTPTKLYNYDVTITAPTPIYDISFDITNTKTVSVGALQVSINDPDNSIVNNLYYYYSTDGTNFSNSTVLADSGSSPYKFTIFTRDISNTIYVKAYGDFGNASNIASISSVVVYQEPRTPPIFNVSLVGSGNVEVTIGENDTTSTIPDYYYLNDISYVAYVWVEGPNRSYDIAYYTTNIGSLSSTNTQYGNVVSYLTGLSANKYKIYLAAKNDFSESSYGDLSNGPKRELVVYTIPPYRPVIDTANTRSTTPGSLTISINDTSNVAINAIYYLYSLDGGVSYGNSGVTNNGNTLYTFTVSDTGNAFVPLIANTYTLSILASNHYGNMSSFPNEVNVYTTPKSPIIDVANTISSTSSSLTISIIDTSNVAINAVYYLYSLDGGVSYGNSGVANNGNTRYIFTVSNTGNAFVPLIANTYTLSIRASNAVGNADDTIYTNVNVYTTPTAPSIDHANTISLSSNQMTVAFFDPYNTLVNQVYYLVSIDGGNTYANTEIACTGVAQTQYNYTILSGFTNGNSYVVLLKATNTVGNSDSVSTNLTEVFTTPGAPILYKMIPQIGAIDIVFIIPAFNGGNAISKYQYYLNDPDDPLAIYDVSVSRQAESIRYATIPDLVNGNTYVVGIRAVNARGGSEWSNTQTAIPFRVPDAPVFTVESYDTFIRLIISPTATFDGGNAITGYQYSLYGNTVVDASGVTIGLPANGLYDVSGLINATTYPVAVRAINARGYSPWSEVVSARPNTLPDSPILYSIDSIPNGAAITFSTPFDGGTPITGYAYSIDNGNTYTSIADSDNITYHDISGLTNGVTYLVRVKAVNKNGLSIAGSNALSVIPFTIPDSPILEEVVSGIGSITVYFQAPAFDGGNAITRYEYSTDNGILFATILSNTMSYTTSYQSNGIDELVNGDSYRVVVRAVNHRGNSAVSTKAVDVVPFDVPDAPILEEVVAGNHTIDISFSAPPTNGGNAITQYEYSVDNNQSYWPIESAMLDATAITYRIEGLENGNTYGVSVRARNFRGYSVASNSFDNIVPYGIPDAPTIWTVPQNRRIEVSFETPNNRGKEITGYKYSVDGGNVYSAVVPFPTANLVSLAEYGGGNVMVNTFRIYNAVNGREYPIHVKTTNSIGDSVASNRSYAIPRTIPDEPEIQRIQPTDGGVDIVFSAPANTGGNAITAYKCGYVLGQ